MPAALSASREYWSVPALIDWMNLSFGARAISLLRHSPETLQHVGVADAHGQLFQRV